MESTRDDELRQSLEKLGFSAGPITETTRSVYQKKLRRLSIPSEEQPNEQVNVVRCMGLDKLGAKASAASRPPPDPLLRLWPSMTVDLQTRLLGAHQRHGKLSVKKAVGALRGSSPAIARTVAILGESSEVLGKSESSAPALESAAARVVQQQPKIKCSQYVIRTCEALVERGDAGKVSCEDFFLQLVGSGPSPLLLQWQKDGFDAKTIHSIYQQMRGGGIPVPTSSHSNTHSPHPSVGAAAYSSLEMPTLATKRDKDVFVSYGRGIATTLYVNRLKVDLQSAGYSVWLDTEDIPSGSEWHAEIGEGLRSCKALVAVITQKYVRSKYCKNELFMADSSHKAIFPVFLEEVDVSTEDAGVSYTISSINWIRVAPGEEGYREGVARLLKGMMDKGIAPSGGVSSHPVDPDVHPCQTVDVQTKPQESSKPLKRFSVVEVCLFVSELELNPRLFRENSVGGEDLLELTEEDMKNELELKPLQVRKLQRKIKHKLAQEPET